MKKSILSLLLVSMFILTGCEKESVESIESSGSITEYDEKNIEDRFLLSGNSRRINVNGCGELGTMYFSNESAAINTLRGYMNCISVTNFAIGGSNSQSISVTGTSPVLEVNNAGEVILLADLKYFLELAVNSPHIVNKIRNGRMSITGVSFGGINWPANSNSDGYFHINVILTPKPFVPLF